LNLKLKLGQTRKKFASDISIRRVAFVGSNEFQVILRHRVDEYFRVTGRRRRDSLQFYVKSSAILLAFLFLYTSLVFWAQTWWQAVPLCILLALVTAGIGFNIMHDGGHGACSRYRFVNRWMARSLDVIGGSSYLWHWKHGVLHHSCPNITGHDTDISLGRLARFTPQQRLYAYQRWQQWYIWPVYGVMAVKWHFYDDFRALLTGTIGPHRIPRPRNNDLVVLIACKLIFFSLAFGIPLYFHPLWKVALCYGLFAVVLGLALSVVFQLAHCVEEAEFPALSEGAAKIDSAWAIHQVSTTVDFCRGNRVVTWLLGGLNYQVEHHLFPRICHSNYPEISELVKEACRDFGIPYNEHPSFWAGIRSHFRWLRRMGRPITIA
jgi:linoleoyl-CoA desaturase